MRVVLEALPVFSVKAAKCTDRSLHTAVNPKDEQGVGAQRDFIL